MTQLRDGSFDNDAGDFGAAVVAVVPLPAFLGDGVSCGAVGGEVADLFDEFFEVAVVDDFVFGVESLESRSARGEGQDAVAHELGDA